MKYLIASLAAAAIAAPALAGASHKPEPRERAEYADLSCQSETLSVYFQSGEATLTPAADESIQAFARKVRGCDITDLETRVGAGDADSLDASKQLAMARRASVLEALSEAGIHIRLDTPDSETEITLAASDAGRALPLSRRADVTFSLRLAAIG